MKRPLTVLVPALMAGIATSAAAEVCDALPAVVLCLSLVGILIALRLQKPLTAGCLIALGFFLAGILDMNVYLRHVPPDDHISRYAGPEQRTVEGTISEVSRTATGNTDATLWASRLLAGDGPAVPVRGKVRLTVRPPVALKYGDTVRFRARLHRPVNYNNPGGFDYERYLRLRGVLVRAVVADASGIVVVREGAGNPFLAKVEAFRNHIRKIVEKHTQTPVREIIQASILGSQREIPREVMERFNRTGTTHIIAISGFNVGIVALLAVFLTRLVMKTFPTLLLRFDWRPVAAVAAAILVTLYTLVAGAGISVIRATLMVLALAIAIVLGKIRDLGNTLALAALVILLAAPYDLFDVSFQLSFAAVAAILAITPRLTRMIPAWTEPPATLRERMKRKGIRSLTGFLAVTTAATLGTLPLVLFYFNRVPTVVLLSNLLVVPVLGIAAVPVCMAVIVAAPLSEALAGIFVQLAGKLVALSLILVEYLAALPHAAVFVTTPSIVEIAAYYALIACVLWLADAVYARKGKSEKAPPEVHRRRSIALPLTAAACLVAFLTADAIVIHGRNGHAGHLTMTAIDVGQGSATLLRLPRGRIVLVDGGGSYDSDFDMGKYVLAPYLWHERIGRVHTVVVTHPHPDHLGGLLYILENFNVQEVWTNGDAAPGKMGKAFEEILVRRGIVRRVISSQTPPMNLEGVAVACLSPPEMPDGEAPGSFEETNDRALVLSFTYGSVRFFLPSDTSSAIEEGLLPLGKGLRSQVLVVGHHGSRHSSSEAFLRAVRPDLAILSVGRENVFHLPHPDTLTRFEAQKIPLLRTDRHGAVTVTTDGAKITTETFLKR